MLSSSYGIIMDITLNITGLGKNIVDGLNATNKRYLNVEMELIGKLGSNDTTNVGVIPSA